MILPISFFAHDATMLVVSMIGIWGSVNAVKNSLAMYKSASQNLAGRETRLTASEVVQNSKGANLISSMDDFLDYTNGFLDEDASQYVKEVLNNDGDDVAKLKKIAQLVEDGSKKIGKKLSKEELKAGLDAFWNDAEVEGALAAIERCFKVGPIPTQEKMHQFITEWTKMYESLADSKTQLSKFNTASIVYDSSTGNYYYGMNRGIQLKEDYMNPLLESWLPESSLNSYKLGNCAEVDAVNQAINDGANVKDLYLYTINTKNNHPKRMCENCVYTFVNRVAGVFSH